MTGLYIEGKRFDLCLQRFYKIYTGQSQVYNEGETIYLRKNAG